jgi:hypothetical protein
MLKKLLSYLYREPVGFVGCTVAIASFVLAAMSYVQQVNFQKLQNENLVLEFKKAPLGGKNEDRLTSDGRFIESKWHLNISNTSIQSASSVVGFKLNIELLNSSWMSMDSDSYFNGSSPFSDPDTNKTVGLPILIPPGGTVRLLMTIPFGTSSDFQKFSEAKIKEYPYLTQMVDNISREYSFSTHDQGQAKDLFGNYGFDTGFSLNAYLSNKEKIKNPTFNLSVRTSRNSYATSAGWYQMIFLIPDQLLN